MFERYSGLMDAGNEFRQTLGTNEAFSLLAAAAVLRSRKEAADHQDWQSPFPRKTYILSSFKRKEEIQALRQMLGDAFILVAAHSPRAVRIRNLEDKISKEHVQNGDPEAESAAVKARKLVERDESEVRKDFGQRLSDAYSLADVFLDSSDPSKAEGEIKRFINLLFAYPFTTPTRDEYAMFLAQGAALRSSDLSRQVGAVISTGDGEAICVGTNEVPKAGGGLYWEGDEPDRRDWRMGEDSGRVYKKRALGQLLGKLDEKDLLVGSPDLTKLADELIPGLTGTDLMNIGEFGRTVHAEMAAIVSAARRGISISDSTIYTTTYPCHVCARHIVAAGIKRVVFNEPYPKSLAMGLHGDSLAAEGEKLFSDQVSVEAFVGVAPRRFIELFTMPKRRDEDRAIDWEESKSRAQPRLSESHAGYFPGLVRAGDQLEKLLKQYGLDRTQEYSATDLKRITGLEQGGGSA